MALKKIIKVYRDDTRSVEWVYYDNDNPQPPIQIKGTNIKHTSATTWFYHVPETNVPPGLVDKDGKRYIVPHWKEVHPQTTLDDIIVVKKKEKRSRKTIERKFKSESSNQTYTTTYLPDYNRYRCTCRGFWMARGNCKHVKQFRLENEQIKK